MLNNNKITYKKTISAKNHFFWSIKRLFDLTMSFALMPILVLMIITLKFLNHFYNKGPVFFIQKRMGKNCKPFYAIKFRSMVSVKTINRNYSDPLEIERITKLGHILRKFSLDELPQILNVIKGDMSLIGPRPDYYEHALVFLDNIPEYRQRHLVRPGISGLSQIRLGYAEGLYETKKKSRFDVYYIKNACFYLDIKIFFGTILTILKAIRTKI